MLVPGSVLFRPFQADGLHMRWAPGIRSLWTRPGASTGTDQGLLPGAGCAAAEAWEGKDWSPEHVDLIGQ